MSTAASQITIGGSTILFTPIIIIGSIVTTSVTSAIGQQPAFKWLAVTISLTVGIAAGFTGYFKFRERAMNLRQTADAIEHEYNAADLGIRRYRGLGHEEGWLSSQRKLSGSVRNNASASSNLSSRRSRNRRRLSEIGSGLPAAADGGGSARLHQLSRRDSPGAGSRAA